MIWWKPTIVRPLVAASFEAHARIVQFEVSEIFERAEQFSLMTSSALTLDNVFNLTSSAVAASVSYVSKLGILLCIFVVVGLCS